MTGVLSSNEAGWMPVAHTASGRAQRGRVGTRRARDMHGAARSSIPGVHEFTTAGIYAADALEGALYYHAVATRLCAPKDEQDRMYDANSHAVRCT